MKKLLYSQKAAPYVFILPFVLTVLVFWMGPVMKGVTLSFQDVLKDQWVGLSNYKRILTDRIFWIAVRNSVKYTIWTLVLLIPFPLFFAVLINSKLMKRPNLRCRRRYRLPSDVRRSAGIFDE